MLFRLFQLVDERGDGFKIILCHQLGTCFGGVNAVLGKAGGSGADTRLGKQTVHGDISVSKFTGKLSCDLDLGCQILAEIRLVGGVEQELLDENDLGVGLFLQLGEDRAVAMLEIAVLHPVVVGVGMMPGVVDTDENGDDVGIVSDGFVFPACEKTFGTVTADALIDEFEFDVGISFLDQLCCVEGVAVTQIVNIRTVSAGIGDAVALEKDFHNFLRTKKIRCFIIAHYFLQINRLSGFFLVSFPFFARKSTVKRQKNKNIAYHRWGIT